MVVGNHATRMNGGGVYENSDPTATVTYDRMTLASNIANLQGGGFYTGISHPVVTNSTSPTTASRWMTRTASPMGVVSQLASPPAS